MKLTESIFEKAKPAEYVDIERLFNTRFAVPYPTSIALDELLPVDLAH